MTTEAWIPTGCVGVEPNVRLIDISVPAAPRVLSTFPQPDGDWCDRGGRFGPHNIHIYLTDRLGGGLHILELSAGAKAARPDRVRTERLAS